MHGQLQIVQVERNGELRLQLVQRSTSYAYEVQKLIGGQSPLSLCNV